MAGQTQVERRNADNGRTVARNLRDELGELAHDVVQLAELQVQLLAADSRTMVRSARRWAIALVAACVIALGSFPIAVLGMAYIVAWSGLNLALSMLLVALVVIAVSAGVVMLSARRMKAAAAPLERSWHELKRNVEWIKQSVSKSRRSEMGTTPVEEVA